MRWLVEFGYDGRGYAGWARQPGRTTVEGTIRERVIQLGLVGSIDRARIEVASRTDAGVSARANALAISSELPASGLLRGLNGIAPDIFFRAIRPVPEAFRVRRALSREYRYYLPGDRRRARALGTIARRLPAAIDARSFGRGLSSNVPAPRPIDALVVRYDGRGVRIDVRAPSFVWGMIRKLVAGILEVEAGRVPIGELRAAAEGSRPLSLPLAPADGLLLWQVRYPGRWTHRAQRGNRGQRTYLNEQLRIAQVRSRMIASWAMFSGDGASASDD